MEIAEGLAALRQSKVEAIDGVLGVRLSLSTVHGLVALLESLSARVTQAETTTQWGYRNESGNVPYTFDFRPDEANPALGLEVVTRECQPWELPQPSPATGNEATNG